MPESAKSVVNKVATEEETAGAESPDETPVEFFASLAELLVIVLFIMTFVLQNFEIPSSSMEDTMLIGDHVFVNREQFAPPTRWLGPLLPYRDIRRNDIVVFLSPEEQGLFVVKRIIGIPGDRIHLRDGRVYRNGQKLDNPTPSTRWEITTLTATISLPYRLRKHMGRATKSGSRNCLPMWRAATLLFLPIVISRWATTATSATTAATGALFPGTT